jgi:hypothetical protein
LAPRLPLGAVRRIHIIHKFERLWGWFLLLQPRVVSSQSPLAIALFSAVSFSMGYYTHLMATEQVRGRNLQRFPSYHAYV